MIIKSHIRGGYRSAAEYLKEQGKNEKTRLVEISDPAAKNLDEAFHNMWVVASNTKCTKPLHHISINPMKDERLTDEQVFKIVERCEEKYGYKLFHHQRVIVEHIKDGRQHFHVIWNRVSLYTGRPVWPGEHWNKSKQVCREMEVELGLKRPVPRRMKRKSLAPKKKRRAKAYRKTKTIRHRIRTKYWQPAKSGKGSWHTPKPRQPKLRAATSKTIRSAALFEQNMFADLAKLAATKISPIGPRPAAQTPKFEPPQPVRPDSDRKGWPPAAVADWEAWGKQNPRRFFTAWPELSR